MRKTYALVQVALALMADTGGRHWGYELSKWSGVRSGVMYPILRRMLDEGWLSDGWERQVQAGDAEHPPRRYYELTDQSKAALGTLIAEARCPAFSGQGICGSFTLLPARSGIRPGLPAVSGTRAWNEDESDYSGVRSTVQYRPWQLSG